MQYLSTTQFTNGRTAVLPLPVANIDDRSLMSKALQNDHLFYLRELQQEELEYRIMQKGLSVDPNKVAMKRIGIVRLYRTLDAIAAQIKSLEA
jgi:hypothetical protein